MKRKLIILSSLSLVLLMTACNAVSSDLSAGTPETATEDSTSEQPAEINGTLAKVTAINGNSITFLTADPANRKRETENKNEDIHPKKARDKGKGASNQNPYENSEDTSNQEISEGKDEPITAQNSPAASKNTNINNKKENMPMMTFGTEETTITVDESTLFFKGTPEGKKSTASLSDITEGTILNIVYSDDEETPSEIIIRK